jgi:hypothetical protein
LSITSKSPGRTKLAGTKTLSRDIY